MPKLPIWLWIAIAGVAVYLVMGNGGIQMPNFSSGGLSSKGGGGYQSNPGFSHSSH